MRWRYEDIGKRVKAFRMASGLSADEVAQKIGISRTALYRVEKGEIAKVETLERLSELLDVSMPTLLGVGIEYMASAVSYFERTRQLEESADQIIVLAGPVSFLLASDEFDGNLEQVLRESVPEDAPRRKRTLQDIDLIMEILRERKRTYMRRRPSIVNLISAEQIERFLNGGLLGRADVPEKVLRARHEATRAEIEHLAGLIEADNLGVQIGVVTDTLPLNGFQIFRQAERSTLTISPFRLGAQPNIRVGVAMLTSAPEALKLHDQIVKDAWKTALKGAAAVQYLRGLLAADEAGREKGGRAKGAGGAALRSGS
ncbi:helix-turn-helix domain-containing protein [Bordetella bronchialis]|uniref:Transcriptional regulator n=1 Tax=Bordetella bronchialis TaxID=463025 RepID=A0A193FTF8_9BORD|nr:helix-turn-helix transcriptional regulator [Bordetella bronchialis]ANN71042.1 transcriptional regulator [Bordetella bronchialis]